MEKAEEKHLREVPQPFRHEASVPNFRATKPASNKVMRAKIFKSGNSLALRLPASLGLEAGMEMELTVEAGGTYALRPANAPKRKIDVSKFAGKAPWLTPLPPEMREFEERELDWHLLDGLGKKA